MPATNRLRRVAQWQNCPVESLDFAAVHEFAFGTKRTNRPHRVLSPIGLTADTSGHRPSTACPLMTQSGHRRVLSQNQKIHGDANGIHLAFRAHVRRLRCDVSPKPLA